MKSRLENLLNDKKDNVDEIVDILTSMKLSQQSTTLADDFDRSGDLDHSTLTRVDHLQGTNQGTSKSMDEVRSKVRHRDMVSINSKIARNGDHAIHMALRSCRVEWIVVLIRFGASLFSKGANGDTPVLIACKMGLVYFLDYFVYGRFPLSAISNARSKTIHEYVDEINAASKEWNTQIRLNELSTTTNDSHMDAVCMAASQGHVHVLEWLHKHQVSLNTVNAKGSYPIHLAAKFGKVEAVDWLLERIDDVPGQLSHANNNHKTPYTEAYSCGNFLLARKLKGKLNPQSPDKSIDGQKLMEYARNGDIANIARLFDQDSSILKHTDQGTSQTLILEAAAHRQLDAVKWIANKVRDSSQYTNSKTGDSILHIAARNNDLDLCEMGVEKFSLDIKAKNADSLSASDVAKLCKSKQVQEYLMMVASRTERVKPSKTLLLEKLGVKSETLKSGQSIDIIESELSDTVVCTISKVNANYICSCSAFQIVNKDIPLHERSCKHIESFLGREADRRRIEAAKIGQSGAVARRVAEWNTIISSSSSSSREEILGLDSLSLQQLRRLGKPMIENLSDESFLDAQKRLMLLTSASESLDDMQLCMSTLRTWENWRSTKKSLKRRHQSSSAGSDTTTLASNGSDGSVQSSSSSISTSTKTSEDMAKHFILDWEELNFSDVIGEGSFGVVFLGTWRGMSVAIKRLRSAVDLSSTSSKADMEEFMNEARLLSRVSHHQNIVPFVGVSLQPKQAIVTKLMKASVEQILVKPGDRRSAIDASTMIRWIIDAAAGLMHLHKEQIIHRDLATRNLLIDESNSVRIADFGFARIKQAQASKGVTMQNIGPICWMAPEALRYRQFSEKSDSFSFGLVIFEMVAGRYPWDGCEAMDVVYRVCNMEREHLPQGCDSVLTEIFDQTQAHDPHMRPAIEQIFDALTMHLSRLVGSLPAGNLPGNGTGAGAAGEHGPGENTTNLGLYTEWESSPSASNENQQSPS